jgi:hypothetical protein
MTVAGDTLPGSCELVVRDVAPLRDRVDVWVPPVGFGVEFGFEERHTTVNTALPQRGALKTTECTLQFGKSLSERKTLSPDCEGDEAGSLAGESLGDVSGNSLSTLTSARHTKAIMTGRTRHTIDVRILDAAVDIGTASTVREALNARD